LANNPLVAYSGGFTIQSISAPLPPSDVLASDGDFSDGVQVTWSEATGATGYEIWRNTVNNSGSSQKIVSNYQFTLYGDNDDNTVIPGETYYYWIKSVGPGGTSGFSSSDFGWRKLPSPTGVNSSDGLNDRIEVTWNPVANATSYEVWRSTSSDSNTAALLQSSISGLSFGDTSASANVIYYYWVKAKRDQSSDFSSFDSGFRPAVTLSAEIRVLNLTDNQEIIDGLPTTSVDFGTTSQNGLDIVKTFRVYNDGNANLVLDEVASWSIHPSYEVTGLSSNQETIILPQSYVDFILRLESSNAPGIGINDLRVIGPNGYNQNLTYLSRTSNSDTTPISANYNLNAPSGGWDHTYNGPYTVQMVANQVGDTSNNTVLSQNLLTFTVDIELPEGLEDHGPNGRYFFDTTTHLYWYDPVEFLGMSRLAVDAFVQESPIWDWASSDQIDGLVGKETRDGSPLATIIGDPQFSSIRWIGYYEDTSFPDGWLIQASNGDDQITTSGGQGNVGTWNPGAWLVSTFDPLEFLPPSADFDTDGDTDGADFLAWQRGYGTTSNATKAQGDADNDGDVDGDDLRVWETNLPAAPSADFDTDGDTDGVDFLAWQRGYGTTSNATKAKGDADNDGDVDGDDLVTWGSDFGIGAISTIQSTTEESNGLAPSSLIASQSNLASEAPSRPFVHNRFEPNADANQHDYSIAVEESSFVTDSTVAIATTSSAKHRLGTIDIGLQFLAFSRPVVSVPRQEDLPSTLHPLRPLEIRSAT